jgi:S-adenosylmethionine decarboxylase
MFVFPHKLILKTCGTTTLLLGLERILRLAHEALGLALPAGVGAEALVVAEREAHDDEDAAFRALGAVVKSTFYSRKSFMFPERQKGPHRDWMLEVAVLDRYLDAGAAYTVGKMNGDHWLLYMAAAPDSPRAPASAQHAVSLLPKLDAGVERPLALPSPLGLQSGSDQTLEVLMTHLSPASCSRFSYPASLAMPAGATGSRGHVLGAQTSDVLGLSTLFPASQLDAFAFEPCGYSANALVPASPGNGAGYWTVHVTPEEGSSYASFETNVEVRAAEASSDSASLDGGALELGKAGKSAIRSFEGLVARVVAIFEPGRLSVTLFTSTSRSGDGDESADPPTADTATDGTSTLNASILDAGSVLHALELPGYRRTDRIAYEFEDYDLVFVSFDRTGSRLPRR